MGMTWPSSGPSPALLPARRTLLMRSTGCPKALGSVALLTWDSASAAAARWRGVAGGEGSPVVA
jgi:hypothetical protein